MDLKEIMAVNLRRKRHDLEMTQEELAEHAGLSAHYVGAIERGDVSASVTVLGQIADALGIEPGDLLRRAGRATKSQALVNVLCSSIGAAVC